MNVDLVKLLAKYYNLDLKVVCDLQGKWFVHLFKEAIEEVFGFEDVCDLQIVYEDLNKEHLSLDITCKDWILPLYKPKIDENPMPLEDGDESPFNVNLFANYF